MAKRRVFYSFHYDNDVFRVQQIRNMGALDGNEPVAANEWEQLRRSGDAAVKRWIDENMKYKNCVVVLIGSDTYKRPYVNYEIEKAWNSSKPLLGIYIHNLKCPKVGTCYQGPNPFDSFTLPNGARLSSQVQVYNPSSNDAYNDIAENIERWIERAIKDRTG